MPANPVSSAAATGAIASLIGQAVKARSLPAGQQTRPIAHGAKRGKKESTLEGVISTRAEELDPDAPDYRIRLLRLVIEASLLQSFGNALIHAPKFQYMVDQVLHDMASAPQLQRDISAMIDMLTRD
jgi:hypothetical protein